MANVKNNSPLSPRPQKRDVSDRSVPTRRAPDVDEAPLGDDQAAIEGSPAHPQNKSNASAHEGVRDSVGPISKGNLLFSAPSHVDTAAIAGEDQAHSQPGVKADPLGLGALQGRTVTRPIQKFSEKLLALADGIDSGVVFGKRLQTILKQLPALSLGDIDRLFAPETHATFALDRTAYLGALERLSQVAPTLEVPPMGLQALEAARLFSLQESLLQGDDDGAIATGKEAAALFPESPLAAFYRSPLRTRPSAMVTTHVDDEENALLDAVKTIANQYAAGTMDPEAVKSAVAQLSFPKAITPETFCESFGPLARAAPQTPIFGDQTVAEAHAYSHILGLAASGQLREAKVEADAFAEAYPTSDRTAWLKDIVVGD